MNLDIAGVYQRLLGIIMPQFFTFLARQKKIICITLLSMMLISGMIPPNYSDELNEFEFILVLDEFSVKEGKSISATILIKNHSDQEVNIKSIEIPWTPLRSYEINMVVEADSVFVHPFIVDNIPRDVDKIPCIIYYTIVETENKDTFEFLSAPIEVIPKFNLDISQWIFPLLTLFIGFFLSSIGQYVSEIRKHKVEQNKNREISIGKLRSFSLSIQADVNKNEPIQIDIWNKVFIEGPTLIFVQFNPDGKGLVDIDLKTIELLKECRIFNKFLSEKDETENDVIIQKNKILSLSREFLEALETIK